MKIQKLKLTNFYAFKDSEVDFEQYESPILIKGITESSEQSNGAGKSSLLEAVYWALTGTSLRGSKVATVIRNGCKKCTVYLKFKSRDKIVEITRNQGSSKDIKLIVNGETILLHDISQYNQWINENIGDVKRHFSIISFFGKYFNTFSKLGQKERAELIDMISGGEIWEIARNRAIENSKQLDSKLNNLKSENVNVLKPSFEQYQNEAIFGRLNLKDLEVAIKQIEKEKSIKAEQLKIQREDINNKIKDLTEQQIKLQTKLKENTPDPEMEKRKKEIEFKLGMEEKQLQSSKDYLLSITKELTQAATDIAIIKHDLEKYNPAQCPNCGFDLGESMEDRENKARNKICQLKVLIDSHEESSKVQKSIIVDLNNKIAKLCIELEKNTWKPPDVSDLVDEMSKIQSDIDSNNQTLKSIDTELYSYNETTGLLAKKKQEMDTLRALVEISYRNAEELDKKISLNNERIAELSEEYEIDKWWKQAFKNIRYQNFMDTVKYLSSILNSCCKNQGLEFDEIKISTEKVKADNTIAPEINIQVIRDGEELPLNNLSEGEIKRVDLACFFSLGILLEKISGIENDFRILDEPLNGLDYYGKIAVFNFLCELSDTKQIFVIDHDSHFQDKFSSVITVQKKNRISEIL